MNIEAWMSFVLASMVLVLSPGPAVLLVIGLSLAHGRKSVVPMMLGILSGDVVALACSLLGVSVVLSTSYLAFSILKWLGVVYFIYLGIKAWCSPISEAKTDIKPMRKAWKVYLDAFLVTALNPKGLVFFLAFLPLFISPEAPNVGMQMLILAVTFIFISFCSVSFYAYFGGRVRGYVSSEKGQRFFNRFSGGMLVSAGLVTSTLKQ
ncbi:lysine transporter LysE [Salinivibrio kushneri]|uniref:Lysine transporter LysE n=1 Tax=Salinivibrio kushneri TaxID=1908198 RepID=A0AB36JY77_9GAMM|nr:LysE family translocator [Salinivibrio kushneri]OOE39911.1 lysine transporter LysE [Salinivibrio kushneri]QCP03502.1 LysE family translocator [Salinivibrio kushneri]